MYFQEGINHAIRIKNNALSTDIHAFDTSRNENKVYLQLSIMGPNGFSVFLPNIGKHEMFIQWTLHAL